MAVYAYKAIDVRTGRRQTGELAADSAYQVRASLRRMDLRVQSISEVRSHSGATRSTVLSGVRERLARSRHRQRIIELYENLGTLLASGSPLVPAIDTLAGSARRSGSGAEMGTMCRRVSEKVRGGSNLADAMDEQPDWFGPIDVALVRSGQSSGHLEQCLADLADMHSQSDALRSRLIGVLAYPAILLSLGIGVVIFLATVPIPQLAGALQDQGGELPTPTKLLLIIGIGFRDYWWALVLLAPLLMAGVLLATRSRVTALWRLRLPVLGPLIAKTQLASFCAILERLLLGGIPLTEAIELATPMFRNTALRSVFKTLPRQLADGRNLAEPLRESGLFDAVFCRVLEIGVESGELPMMIGTIGRRYALISRRLIDRFATVVEPLVIVILAILLGSVVYAAILPMLRLTQMI
ncbi:MAG: type II secretion system F family protein [Phycisphaerales bacterium]|nr:type II secretion system F family protein [Phycisphaerales bacterium]